MNTRHLAAALALTLLASDTAFAQADQNHRGKFREACGADIQKFCPAASDRDARRACMETNKAKLSAPCKTLLEKFAARRAQKNQ